MKKLLSFFLFILFFSFELIAMEKRPYHHLPDGTFRNPEGSPERDPNVKWSYKIFNEERKKIKIEIFAIFLFCISEVVHSIGNKSLFVLNALIDFLSP